MAARSDKSDPDALIIGAGPAGLMAAEMLTGAGHSVLIAEKMPSPARKFLMAGKSGLNLTKEEAPDAFVSAYGPLPAWFQDILAAFGPEDVHAWAEGLGQPLFTGSSGRVFPRAMKASPLLRAWLARLAAQGATLSTRWQWTGFDGAASCFDTPDGPQKITPRATVLAMGGASWARLGSDGTWAGAFPQDTASFQPANAALSVAWSDHMTRHFGTPVKSTRLIAGGTQNRGEFILSARGLEGGGIYAVSRAIREGAPLTLDLLPDLGAGDIRARLARKGKASLSQALRKILKLSPVKQALLSEFGRPLPSDLAPLLKALPVLHQGLRPLDEAISTAGGLRLEALDPTLMLRARPGTFAAGEMLDWEAPTGGYLLTACFATGAQAGASASDWLCATTR